MSENSGNPSRPQQSGPGPTSAGGGPSRPQERPAAPDSGGAPPPDDPLRGSRTSGVWIATAGIGILLVLLVIFIVQNTQEVDVAYLGWEGRLPLAAAILVATAAGILITTAAGGLRILQLRRRVKKDAKTAKTARKREAKEAEKQDARAAKD